MNAIAAAEPRCGQGEDSISALSEHTISPEPEPTPLLEVRGLAKHFPVTKGLIRQRPVEPLPDETLQQGRMIGHVIKNFRRGQAII